MTSTSEWLIVGGATLVDGAGGPPVASSVIVVRDGVVVAAGADTGPGAATARAAAAAAGATTIDAAGLWAAPGLIDTHVHLELVGRETLPLWLALGVTTIRDLGGALEFLLDARRHLEGGAPGPRLLFTGPMIDGEPPTWPTLVRSTPDANAAAAAVEEHIERGADAIKLYTTLPPESLRRCIEQAAGRVPVTGHLGRTPAGEAMEAGINGLEHALLTPYNDLAPADLRTAPGELMTSPGFWQKVNQGWLKADFDSDSAKRWVELLVACDVSLCPTLTVVPGAGDEPGPEELRYAPRVAERWLEATSQRAALAVPPEAQAAARRVRERLQELVARVHRAGGRVVAGTDTGAVRSLVPGFALHHELEFLAGAGLSPAEALAAATSRAAEAVRRPDLGVIAPGKRADFILLRRDPLADVAALREIDRVVAGGRAFSPADLLAMATGVGRLSEPLVSSARV